MVFIDDEGIRSLVALEMSWTGNYLVPTLHGDLYLNKPPLWNWVQAGSFWLWGESSEWSARFPTVIALLGFAATAYRFSRPVLGPKLAFIHAFTIITCGRMLFWDSMLALIDVTFSWVVYTQFMLLWYYWQRAEKWKAFGFVYLLCAFGFLLKGLPAIAFTGITVISLLVWQGRFLALFSPAHLISGLGCLALLACYYVPLAQEIDLSLVASRLFVESGKRTAVNYAWTETAAHLLAFPFEMIYHFLPWTLLLVFLVRKDLRTRLGSKPTIAYWLVIFLANLPLYWLSPNVYPRYLLMLFPLLFGAGLYFYKIALEEGRRIVAYFHGFVSLLMILFTLGFFFIPLHPQTDVVDHRWLWAAGGGLTGLLILWFGKAGLQSSWGATKAYGVAESLTTKATSLRPNRLKAAHFLQQSLLSFVAFLLLLRLTFNVFILPPRAVSDVRGQRLRTEAMDLAHEYRQKDEPLAVFGYSLMEPATSYYLERAYGGIVPRQFDGLDSSTAYIVNPWQYPYAKDIGKRESALYFRHSKLVYPVVRFQAPFPATTYELTELQDGMGTGEMIHR